jgi:2-polyprenyl-3-methyl-5-hydroxy-6-metoxy-1,4-benzoquinol methylase
MLPFLAQHSQQVTAVDIDLLPLERLRTHIPLAANIEVFDAKHIPVSKLAPASFDMINALDVLEHVEDLPGTLSELIRLLKPGGQLIVSGPTESTPYRIGRKLAGPEYSGTYHRRGIAEIRRTLMHFAKIEYIATLYPPVPFFEIFSARIS